jgi:hypothetical protein
VAFSKTEILTSSNAQGILISIVITVISKVVLKPPK